MCVTAVKKLVTQTVEDFIHTVKISGHGYCVQLVQLSIFMYWETILRGKKKVKANRSNALLV